MSKKIILWFVMSIITISSFAFGQEEFVEQFGDRNVVEISINGLKRTTEKTLKGWLEISEGNQVSDYDVANIYKGIEDKSIFSLAKSVEFVPTDNDAVMIINVAEKFSFFALPFYSSIDGDSMYGGAAFDSNFWGYGSTLLAVGVFSKKTVTTFLLLNQDEMLNNEYSGKLMVSYRTNDLEISDIHDNPPYYESKQNTISLGGSLGKKFLDKKFTIGPNLEWQDIEMDNDEGNLEKDGNFIFPGVEISYEDTKQDFLFRDGFKAEILTSRVISLNDNYDDFIRSNANLSYSKTYKSKVNFSLRSKFGLFDKPDLSEDMLSILGGTKNLSADDSVDGIFAVEHTLISKHKLNPTLSYYYEGGYYNNDGLNEKYHGIGSAIKVYFDKVAIPALGVGVFYNFMTEEIAATFSFGMGGQ